MHDIFQQAHAFTAQWEGGLNTHEAPMDVAVHYGVSSAWLESLEEANKAELLKLMHSEDGCNVARHSVNASGFIIEEPVAEEDVLACTCEQAQALFKQYFWQALHCQKLPAALALVLYDSAVNMGAPWAVRLLQESCNVVGDAHLDEFTPVQENGLMGQKTLALAKSLQAHGLGFYTARLFVRQRMRFYTKIAQKNKSLAEFLPSWKKRCQALLEHLALWEREA